MIYISSSLLETVASAGELSYPIEACGLVVGVNAENSSKIVTQIIKSKNIDTKDPYHRFELDPQVHFDTIHMLAKKKRDHLNEVIIGHYHSHPDSPACPSTTDASMVHAPNLIWFIASIINKKYGETKAYLYNKKTLKFEVVPLRICPSTS